MPSNQEKPMPSTTRRTYPQETFDAIARRFDTAPPAPEPPKQWRAPALVRALAPKIRQMTEKGYSWQAIAAMMADNGVMLSPNVLRKYVSVAPDKAKTKKRTKGGPNPRTSRSRAVTGQGAPAPGRASATPAARDAAAEHVIAQEDAWDDLESVEETDVTRKRAPSAATAIKVARAEPARVAGGRRLSSPVVVEPDTEDL
jgi:hypothetical protein